jgi:hypothetical protein
MSVLFLYAYRPTDLKNKHISGQLKLLSDCIDIDVVDVSTLDASDIEKLVEQKACTHVILNCHASGQLSVLLGKNVVINLQGDYAPESGGSMLFADSSFPIRLRKSGVTNMLVLACHAGQRRHIQHIKPVPVFTTIKTEYSLSFTKCHSIIKNIVESTDKTNWGAVENICDESSSVYFARRMAKLGGGVGAVFEGFDDIDPTTDWI